MHLAVEPGRPERSAIFCCSDRSADSLKRPIGQSLIRAHAGPDQGLRKFVFESMAMRMIDVMVLAEELAFRRMDQRLGRLLLDRFSGRRGPCRGIATNHEELAKELGTAREVVSRLLKELEREGAVRITRGHIDLLAMSVLVRLAASPDARSRGTLAAV